MTFLLPLIGNGPVWKESVEHPVNLCRHNWWTNLLYVSNWIESDRPVRLRLIANNFHKFELEKNIILRDSITDSIASSLTIELLVREVFSITNTIFCAIFCSMYYPCLFQCLLQTWFLSCDFQFHLMALLVIIPLLRNKRIGIAIASSIILMASLFLAAKTYINNYPPAPINTQPQYE
jgi:hypothetical protein